MCYTPLTATVKSIEQSLPLKESSPVPSNKESSDKSPETARRSFPGYLLLWLLVILSLLLNLLMLAQFVRLQRTAQEALAQTSAMLADLQSQTITLTIPIHETVVIDTDLPIDETITVPIRTEVPVATSVTVPVDAGVLGEIPVTIPIRTTIPVNLSTEVPIDQTFAIHTPVTLDMEIPVEIVVADTPLYDTLETARQTLDGVTAQLEPNNPLRR